MIRLFFVAVLLVMGCQAVAPVVDVCRPQGCLPDEHFDVDQCSCKLNDDASLE